MSSSSELPPAPSEDVRSIVAELLSSTTRSAEWNAYARPRWKAGESAVVLQVAELVDRELTARGADLGGADHEVLEWLLPLANAYLTDGEQALGLETLRRRAELTGELRGAASGAALEAWHQLAQQYVRCDQEPQAIEIWTSFLVPGSPFADRVDERVVYQELMQAHRWIARYDEAMRYARLLQAAVSGDRMMETAVLVEIAELEAERGNYGAALDGVYAAESRYMDDDYPAAARDMRAMASRLEAKARDAESSAGSSLPT